MDRNIALEFVRVTEAAAIACAPWFGKGDKIAADQAAVDAMRSRLNSMEFDGTVVIGEGEKDEAPLLYIGERVGTKKGPSMDIAVDPLECTSNLANGRLNSMAILAAAPKGHLLKAPGTYMEKIVGGPAVRGKLNIRDPIGKNLERVGKALGKPVKELTVAILDRPRHTQLIETVRKCGARVMLIEHGDVAVGVACAMPDSGIDLSVGVGGAPEGVITAAAMQCLGGEMQGILRPHEEKFAKQAKEMKIDVNHVFTLNELANPEQCLFVATAITTGPILKGITYGSHCITTHSVVMRSKSGTIRFIKTLHREK